MTTSTLAGNGVPRDAVIQLDRIVKRFGQYVAVHDAHFTIGRGEFFSLLGPSGCGKTTTLRMIAGFEQPTDGRILLEGQDVGPVVAVHDEQSVPRNPSIDELSAWYGQRGLDAAKLRAAMASPSLADRLAGAHRFAVRSGVEGTPTLIVNGRYRILGRSLEELLRNADAVIAQLRTPAR